MFSKAFKKKFFFYKSIFSFYLFFFSNLLFMNLLFIEIFIYLFVAAEMYNILKYNMCFSKRIDYVTVFLFFFFYILK